LVGETTVGTSAIGVGVVLEGKYEIVRELGHGAMGVVFEARHRSLNKRVAVKTLHTELVEDPDLIARFRQEAQAASAIGHPNIVEVFDLGEVGDATFMVMEFLEGRNLGELLDVEPMLAPERGVKIISQTLSALGAAHQQGIVHRDLKPENIFLTRRGEAAEFVKLLDFGIAKVLAAREGDAVRDTPKPTQFGMIMGTPQYMSPEQARGLPDVDHRADVWAAGCVLYEMLCGRTPFEGENYNQVLTAIIDGQFPRPTDLRPAIPPALEAVVLKAMGYQRAQRYDTAVEMRHDLHTALQAPATVAARPAAPAKPLAPAQTGLAAAATGSSSFDTASLGALGAGDAALVSLDAADDSEPAPAPSAPRAAGTPAPERAAPPPSADMFAPPAEEAEVALDVSGLDLREPATSPALRRTTGSTPAQRRSSGVQPRHSGTIHRPEPTSGAGTFIKALLVLAVLGAGAGAAYRYFTLGYILRAPDPEPIEIELAVSPDDAEIIVNEEPLAELPLMGTPSERYVIEARKAGRLGVRHTIDSLSKSDRRVQIRLPRGMTPLDHDLASVEPAAAPAGGATPEWVDKAFGKIELYEACVEAVGEPRKRSEDAYTASTRRSPSKRNVPNIAPIDATLLSECKLRIEQGSRREPPMEALEAAGAAYLLAIAELVPLVKTASIYYTKREFEQDGFKWGKKTHGQLVSAHEGAAAAERALVEALAAERATWEGLELEIVERSMGKRGFWHLRNLAMRADRWVRTVVAGAPNNAQAAARDELEAAFTAIDRYRTAQPDEIAAIAGAVEFMRGVEPLRRMAAKQALDGKDRNEVLTWHNQAIELFNKIVLAR
jgi:tRNA A-37 threonylcarbamoyl transferase component Bud32